MLLVVCNASSSSLDKSSSVVPGELSAVRGEASSVVAIELTGLRLAESVLTAVAVAF